MDPMKDKTMYLRLTDCAEKVHKKGQGVREGYLRNRYPVLKREPGRYEETRTGGPALFGRM